MKFASEGRQQKSGRREKSRGEGVKMLTFIAFFLALNCTEVVGPNENWPRQMSRPDC